MPPSPSAPPTATPPSFEPAPAPKKRWLGSVIAVLALAALGALAWYLTHPAAGTGAAGPGTCASGAA